MFFFFLIKLASPVPRASEDWTLYVGLVFEGRRRRKTLALVLI